MNRRQLLAAAVAAPVMAAIPGSPFGSIEIFVSGWVSGWPIILGVSRGSDDRIIDYDLFCLHYAEERPLLRRWMAARLFPIVKVDVWRYAYDPLRRVDFDREQVSEFLRKYVA